MSEYLSKEEIKQWRSSLEKITLEEYAARLGKKLEQEKQTNDLVDIVLKGRPVVSETDNWSMSRGEKITSIARRAFEREKEIAPTPFSVENFKSSAISTKTTEKKSAPKKAVKAKTDKKVAEQPEKDVIEEVRIVLKKALTDREQKVFDYFIKNKNHIVYAKDLANLLDLPRDYVYKYIKNLRAKIDGGKLQNADKGGFILNV